MHHGEKVFQNERRLPLHETPHKRKDNSDEVPLPFGSSFDRNDRLNRLLIDKNLRFQNMKAVLEEKIKSQRKTSKLSQFEYHPPNEEVDSSEQLSFQEYPSIPILNDQNQIQAILQQQVVDKIENTDNPLNTLDSMLSEKKLEVQELILAVNKGDEVEEQFQEALQEQKAISEVIDVIEENLKIKRQEETPPLLTKDEVIKIKEDTQNSMLDRLETTDNNPMTELQNMISEMEEKVNDVNMNIDYTPISTKEVQILKVQLDAAEEISEIIDNRNATFITPTTTPITPFFFQRHVPDEFKPLTADEVTILQMQTQERLEKKTE
jgi:hypothetical protein